jgi:hypothetical protein
MSNIDIVYVLGNGSKWNNNELRYSLRSVEKHFKHREVFIVGERPDWLQNINHINCQDTFAYLNGGKFKNVIRKIRAACLDDRVSDSFVLMNDDFFFLEDKAIIWPYTNGTLQEMIDSYYDKTSQYYNALVRTMKFLQQAGIEEPKNFAVHYPIVYEKAKFLEMTNDIDWLDKAYSWRTIYGNLYSAGHVDRQDTKISSTTELSDALFYQHQLHGDFLSISDNVALDPRFQNWIAERLPTPSKYEKIN